MNVKLFFASSALIFFSCFAIGQNRYEQVLVDSLESYRTLAEPGWDELDLVMGLYTWYAYLGSQTKADEQLQRVYEIGRQQDLPVAAGYGRVLEMLRAFQVDRDVELAMVRFEEAIKIARRAEDLELETFAHYNLGEQLINIGQSQKALEVLQVAAQNLNAQVSLFSQAKIHQLLGYALGLSGDPLQGLEHVSQATENFKKLLIKPPIGAKTGRVSTLHLFAEWDLSQTLSYGGELHFMLGDMGSALAAKLRAVEQIEPAGQTALLGQMYVEVGRLFAEMGSLSQAIAYFQKARLLFESINAEASICQVNVTMIPTLVRMSEFELAEELANDNIAYYQQVGDTVRLASTYVHASGIFLILEDVVDLPKSRSYLESGAPYVQQVNQPKINALNARMWGMYEKRSGRMQESHQYLKEALRLNGDDNLLFRARVIYDVADNFIIQSNYDSARWYATKAMHLAQQLGDQDLAMDSYQMMSTIAEATGAYREAYQHHVQFFSLYDSLFKSNAQAKLKEEEVRQGILNYQQDKELAERNASLMAERNKLFMIAGGVLLLIVCLMLYLYVSLRRVKAKTQSQNQQLLHLNQTKDKFFGIIAHDLRSPLLGLQGVGDQVDYFLKKGETERLEKVSKGISKTTKKLNELLDNLLNWALLQNGMIPYHPELVVLRPVVVAAMDLMTPVADMKGVRLECRVGEGVQVYADEKAVHTILRNLISNALKFTETGGAVTISSTEEGNEVSVHVQDTGVGMGEEEQRQLFELQKESKAGTNGEKGTGLGLVLCKELVELNKGSIQVASESGTGATFSFNLPGSI